MLISHLIVQLWNICSFRRCQLTSGSKSFIVRLWGFNLHPTSHYLFLSNTMWTASSKHFCINSLSFFSHPCHDEMGYSENWSHSKFWLLYAFSIEYCHPHSKSSSESIVVNLCMHVAKTLLLISTLNQRVSYSLSLFHIIHS